MAAKNSKPAPKASKPVAKAPVKAVAKPIVKAPVKAAAKPVAKAPVKAVAKPVAKAPVKAAPVAAKLVAKAPVKAAPVAAKPVAKAPVKAAPVAAKPVAKAPVKAAVVPLVKPVAVKATPVPAAKAAPKAASKSSAKVQTKTEMPKREPMPKIVFSKSQKQIFEKSLLELREEMLEQYKMLTEVSLESSQSAGEDSADIGTDNFIREMNLDIASEDGRKFTLIQDALRRLEANEFGGCVDCRCAIEFGRLEAMPYAKLCVKCKTKREESQVGGRSMVWGSMFAEDEKDGDDQPQEELTE